MWHHLCPPEPCPHWTEEKSSGRSPNTETLCFKITILTVAENCAFMQQPICHRKKLIKHNNHLVMSFLNFNKPTNRNNCKQKKKPHCWTEYETFFLVIIQLLWESLSALPSLKADKKYPINDKYVKDTYIHAYKIAEGKLTYKCCINISGVYKTESDVAGWSSQLVDCGWALSITAFCLFPQSKPRDWREYVLLQGTKVASDGKILCTVTRKLVNYTLQLQLLTLPDILDV